MDNWNWKAYNSHKTKNFGALLRDTISAATRLVFACSASHNRGRLRFSKGEMK